MTPLTDAQLAAIAACNKRCDALLAVIVARDDALTAAQATIGQRGDTLHGLSKIIDGHEAEVEDLSQRCDKAVFDLAAAQATIERLTTALAVYNDDTNWSYALLSVAGEDEEPFYYWSRGGDNQPWSIADAALAPSAPEADDAR